MIFAAYTKLVVFTAFISTSSFAGELIVGQLPPPIKLEGESGAKVDGTAWNSDMLKGKVTSFFYVDPDERSSNEPLEAAFKKEQFPFETHQSVAVINMAASWLPNSILASKLAGKQEEFPMTTYVKDFKKVLVSAWGLKDDAVNVVIFDKDGKVLVLNKGPYSEAELPNLVKIIRAAL